MHATDYIKRQIAQIRSQTTEVLQGITDEQLHWSAPDTTNTIGTLYFHLIWSEDSIIHGLVRGQPRLFDSGDWGNTLTIHEAPRWIDWANIKHAALAVAPLMAYEQAVHEATNTFLGTLTDAELSREVTFAGNPRLIADVLARFVVHHSVHTGEIALIKGVHGLKGLAL